MRAYDEDLLFVFDKDWKTNFDQQQAAITKSLYTNQTIFNCHSRCRPLNQSNIFCEDLSAIPHQTRFRVNKFIFVNI